MVKNKHVPKHIKQLRGTTRKDRDDSNIVLPIIDYLPDPPEYYSGSQKKIWIDIIKNLHSANALQTVGLPLVHGYCIQYGIFEAAQSLIKNPTDIMLTYITKHGDITKKNPAIDVLNGALSQMVTISDRFGFSPLSQSKINVKDGDEKKAQSKFDI